MAQDFASSRVLKNEKDLSNLKTQAIEFVVSVGISPNKESITEGSWGHSVMNIVLNMLTAAYHQGQNNHSDVVVETTTPVQLRQVNGM